MRATHHPIGLSAPLLPATTKERDAFVVRFHDDVRRLRREIRAARRSWPTEADVPGPVGG